MCLLLNFIKRSYFQQAKLHDSEAETPSSEVEENKDQAHPEKVTEGEEFQSELGLDWVPDAQDSIIESQASVSSPKFFYFYQGQTGINISLNNWEQFC